MSNSKMRKGFTLIELLVVVAIISILTGILFPVFARARENARRASCMSNLKQIGIAFQMYSQDYDERFPKAYLQDFASANLNRPYGWADSLRPYLKNGQIFQCPSESEPPGDVAIPKNPNYTDYWMNAMASDKNMAAFEYPSETVLSGDGGVAKDSAGSVVGYNDGRANYNTDGSQKPYKALMDCTGSGATSGGLARIPGGGAVRHLDGGNYAFIDGHVKWIKGVTGYALARDQYTEKSLGIMNCGTKHEDAKGLPTFAID